MKNYLINVFYESKGFEGGPSGVVSDSEKVDKKESRETNKNIDIVKNLDKRTKKLFGIGEKNKYYETRIIPKKGIEVVFKDDKSKELDKKLLGFDFIKMFDDKVKNGAFDSILSSGYDFLETISSYSSRNEMLHDIENRLSLLSNSINYLKSEKNSIFEEVLIKDNTAFKALLQTLTYSNEFNIFDYDDFTDLVDVYRDKLLKGKTKEEQIKLLSSDFIVDIVNGGENISFYESEAFDELDGKVFDNKGKKIDNFILASYGTVLSLNLFKKEQLVNEPIINIDFSLLQDYEFNYIADKLKPGEKVSINELTMLNLFLSGKKQNIIKYFGNSYEEKLHKLANKFGYSDINGLKNFIYGKNVNVSNVVKDLKENKDMFYHLPLKEAKYIAAYVNNYMNPKLSKDEREENHKKLCSSLSMMNNSDRKILLNKLNPILEKNGLEKVNEKKLDKIYKQKVEDFFLIMNGIEGGLNKEKAFQDFVSLLPNGVKITQIDSFKEEFFKFLSKENINSLKDEFSKSSGSPMQFFIDKVFNSSDLGSYLKVYDGDNWKEPSDIQKTQIVNVFMSIVKNNLKKTNILDSVDLVNSNESFRKIVDPIFDKFFKGSDNDKSLELKKDLLKMNFKYVISKIIPENGVLTKDVIEQNRENIISMMKEQIGNSKGEIDMKYLKLLENILNIFESKIPPEGLKFDVKELENIRNNFDMIEKIEKDQQLYEELGYEGYVRYYENLEAEKQLIEGTGGIRKTSVTMEESPFKDKNLDANKVETVYEEKDGIHTIYMHLPGIKNEVVKIDALRLADANKEAINMFFNEMFGFPIKIEGNIDDINRLVSKDTNISEKSINSTDFEEITLKAQNVIYHNFYENGGKKELSFLRTNHLEDPYLMYKDPLEFGRRFSKGIKEQTSIGGIKADLNGYVIDMNNISSNLLAIENARQTKENVLDNGKKKEFGFFALAGDVQEKASNMGNKIIDKFTSFFS